MRTAILAVHRGVGNEGGGGLVDAEEVLVCHCGFRCIDDDVGK